jgi:hypothetical protein
MRNARQFAGRFSITAATEQAMSWGCASSLLDAFQKGGFRSMASAMPYSPTKSSASAAEGMLAQSKSSWG